MSTDIRELIMVNVKDSLQAIISIGQPSADVANSGNPQNLIVQTSGTFTHTTKTQYRVQITVAGISGTAKCTITDITDGVDTVVLAQTITSGTAINLGTRGGKITFIIPSGDAMVLNDKWVVTCDTYNHTVKDVLRAKATGINLKEFPAIVFADMPQRYELVSGNQYNVIVPVHVEGWIEERDNLPTDLNKFLYDIERALNIDVQRGGYAVDTIFLTAETGLPEESRPFGAVILDMEINFKHVVPIT